MPRFIRENGLTIAMFALFAGSLVGQLATGYMEKNEDRVEHGAAPESLPSYVASGHFVEAVFENWESEFLQMGAFVVLTAFLRQKGSPESKPLDGEDDNDRAPRRRKGAPWPVQRGGMILRLYENSLGVALLLLFVVSFSLHAIGGAAEFNDDQALHGSAERVTALGYVTTSRFWFESFQNWQSEFMSVGALVVLSIFLRQRGSPESKPVDEAHATTGE
jgi:hypothetical protein